MLEKSTINLVPGRRFQMIRLLLTAYPLLTLATVVTGLIGGVAGVVLIDYINSALQEQQGRERYFGVFVALSITVLMFKSMASFFPAFAARKIVTSLRISLCKKILATPLQKLESEGVHKLLALLSNDITVLSESLLMLPMIFISATIVFCSVIYIAYLSLFAFAFTVCSVLCGISIYSFFYKRSMSLFRKTRQEINLFNEYSHGLLFGIKELQLNHKRRRWFTKAAFGFSARRIAGYNFVGRLYSMLGENIGQTVYFILIGLLIFATPFFQHIESSTLTACILAVLYGMEPLEGLTHMVPGLSRGSIACERLAAFGLSITKEQETLFNLKKGSDHSDFEGWSEIRLNGIRMSYQPEDSIGFTLGPIDLKLQPGELVFIGGGNGSGKSTLSKIITGLYAPTHGEILIDGKPVTDKNREAYRGLFATVFSDFYVFKQLITNDDKMATTVLVQNYLSLLKLNKKVEVQRSKLSTTTALSQGERKRLALLNAYIEDRPIYLLDEWAADQDPAFKDFFYKELLPELKARGKCVIAITHDDRYFPLADRLIKLEEGRIVSDISARQ